MDGSHPILTLVGQHSAEVIQIDGRIDNSNRCRARLRIAEISRLLRKLDAQAADVGIALTRGTSAVSFAEQTAETVRDLRIAAADLEAFARLIDAEDVRPTPPEAA